MVLSVLMLGWEVSSAICCTTLGASVFPLTPVSASLARILVPYEEADVLMPKGGGRISSYKEKRQEMNHADSIGTHLFSFSDLHKINFSHALGTKTPKKLYSEERNYNSYIQTVN